MAEVKELALSQLRLDGGTQIRARLDQGAVTEYASMIQDGSQSPPIEVFFDGSEYWVAEGFHRIEAHRKAGLGVIRSNIYKGKLQDAKIFAAGSNANHGVRRTRADIERAFELLMEAGWRNHAVNAIRKHLKTTAEVVNQLLSAYDERQATVGPPDEDFEEAAEPEVEQDDEFDEPEPEPEKPNEKVVQRGDGTTYKMRTDNIGRHQKDKQGVRLLTAAAKTLGVLQDHLAGANWEVAGQKEVPCKPQVQTIQEWIDRHRTQA